MNILGETEEEFSTRLGNNLEQLIIACYATCRYYGRNITIKKVVSLYGHELIQKGNNSYL